MNALDRELRELVHSNCIESKSFAYMRNVFLMNVDLTYDEAIARIHCDKNLQEAWKAYYHRKCKPMQ